MIGPRRNTEFIAVGHWKALGIWMLYLLGVRNPIWFRDPVGLRVLWHGGEKSTRCSLDLHRITFGGKISRPPMPGLIYNAKGTAAVDGCRSRLLWRQELRAMGQKPCHHRGRRQNPLPRCSRCRCFKPWRQDRRFAKSTPIDTRRKKNASYMTPGLVGRRVFCFVAKAPIIPKNPNGGSRT